MKRIVIVITLTLLSLSLNAKDICTNKSTGAILNETEGIYSIRGLSSGAIILGDIKTTTKTLLAMDACFAKEGINKVLDADLSKDYEVHQDKDGWYIIKAGLGLSKIRPSDVNLFLTTIGGRSAIKAIGKASNWISDKTNDILK